MKLFVFLAASALAQNVDVCKDNCESRHEGRIQKNHQVLPDDCSRHCTLWWRFRTMHREFVSSFWIHFKAELANCNGDERCIQHANDMFRRCLNNCDNGGQPPSCTENCDQRLQAGSTEQFFAVWKMTVARLPWLKDELRRCGDDEECQKRAHNHHEHCLGEFQILFAYSSQFK